MVRFQLVIIRYKIFYQYKQKNPKQTVTGELKCIFPSDRIEPKESLSTWKNTLSN